MNRCIAAHFRYGSMGRRSAAVPGGPQARWVSWSTDEHTTRNSRRVEHGGGRSLRLARHATARVGARWRAASRREAGSAPCAATARRQGPLRRTTDAHTRWRTAASHRRRVRRVRASQRLRRDGRTPGSIRGRRCRGGLDPEESSGARGSAERRGCWQREVSTERARAGRRRCRRRGPGAPGWRQGGGTGGARMGSPRWRRILAMTSGSVTVAMRVMRSPHRGQGRASRP